MEKDYSDIDEIITLRSENENMRLDAFISKKVSKISRSFAKELIEAGNVKVNQKIKKAGYAVNDSDIIEVYVPVPKTYNLEKWEVPLDILYEDEFFIAVNKPKGMLVHQAPGNYENSLVNALLSHCGKELSDINGVIRPGIVHRLDKDTSGVIICAKDNKAHLAFTGIFKDHLIKKEYIAVTDGVPKTVKGKIDAPIGRHESDRIKMAVNIKNGRMAVSHYEIIESFHKNAYLKVFIETGRTHQIRVHLAYIGCSVAGDEVYGIKKGFKADDGTAGQYLHAKKLSFKHPFTNKHMEIDSGIPDYFQRALDRLREELTNF